MLSSGLRGQLYNQDNNGKRLLDETGSYEDLPGLSSQCKLIKWHVFSSWGFSVSSVNGYS